nr:MAG TPA: hypothetical protein [Caudoviricetes sp.]
MLPISFFPNSSLLRTLLYFYLLPGKHFFSNQDDYP